MDEMFRAAAMATAFLICLGIFHSSCQSDHKLLSHPFNSTRDIALWVFAIAHILFLQMCQADSRLFLKWLVTLKFPQDKKLVVLGLEGSSAVWILELQELYQIFLLSLPGSP